MDNFVATLDASIEGGRGMSTIRFGALRSEIAATFLERLLNRLRAMRHVSSAYTVRSVVVVEHNSRRVQPNGLAKQLRCAGREARVHVKTSVVKAKA